MWTSGPTAPCPQSQGVSWPDGSRPLDVVQTRRTPRLRIYQRGLVSETHRNRAGLPAASNKSTPTATFCGFRVYVEPLGIVGTGESEYL